MAQHNQLGKVGEKKAVKFLQKEGYKILDKNFKNLQGKMIGEIDIVALDKKNDEIVFIEVKSRKQTFWENVIPEENITNQKLSKLSKIAQIYLKNKKMEEKSYRFDAISLIFEGSNNKARIRHIIGL